MTFIDDVLMLDLSILFMSIIYRDYSRELWGCGLRKL